MSDEPKLGRGTISEPTLAHHVLARVEALEARVDQLETRAVSDAPTPGEPGYELYPPTSTGYDPRTKAAP